MTTNVLIGVGGTGAKVVEAALWLFLAGLGPQEVIVGLVDQDNANGNVARTKKLLKDISRVRQDFDGSRNKLDWETSGDDSGTWFARVKLTPLMGEDPHWRPSHDGALSLADILQRDGMEREPGLTDLFDVLFEKGPREQGMSLEEGYRGRAHVGSAAMLASMELGDQAFKRRMEELIDRGGQNEEVRIFLVGSVFGGTGAAGFPTLARALDAIRETKARDDEWIGKQVRIGGALMLPYFGFDDPKDKGANVVRTNDLLPQARSALEYYNALFRDEPMFDRFYVAGWDTLFRMGYHQPGATGQQNPAMPPELIGALAVLDFLSPKSLGPRGGPVPVMVSARDRKDRLFWTDLPAADSERKLIYDRLGRLLRLALYWRYEVEPELDKRKNLFHRSQPWMTFLAKDVDWENDTPEARQRLLDLLRDFLFWAGSMELLADQTGGGLDFALWNTRAAHDSSHTPSETQRLSVRGPSLNAVDIATAIAVAQPKLDDQLPVRGSDTILAELNQRHPAGKNVGLGKMLAAVHRAARPTDLNTGAA
jgi:hypothetical protein